MPLRSEAFAVKVISPGACITVLFAGAVKFTFGAGFVETVMVIGDDTVDKPFYDRMHARWQTVNREKIRQLRSSTVEPVLGTLVNYLAMRRVNTRGIKQANKCIIMSAIAYNLKKLLKWEQRKRNTVVMAMRKAEKSLYLNFFELWRLMSAYKTLEPNFTIA